MGILARASFVALLLVVAGLLLQPGSARAAEFLTGGQATIPDGQTVDDDVYIFSGMASVEGTVARDLTVAAGTVTISGQVDGNLNVAGGNVTVTGPVRGSVRIAAGTVTVNAPVGWDLLVSGGTVQVGGDGQVGHDVLLGSGTATIDGDVARDVRGGAGSLTINGMVGRDVRVEVDSDLNIGPQARIGGDLVYKSSQTADIADGAAVAGQTIHREAPRRDTVSATLSWFGSLLLRLAWALLAGTALVLLLPVTTAGVATTLRERPLVSLGWGFGVLVVIPIVVLVLLITIIGLPLGLGLAGLYIAALYLSQVVVGVTLGRLVMPRSWRDAGRLHLWVTMLIGVTVVVIVRLLPLPYGWTFWWSLLIGFFALGAIWTYFTGWGREPRPAPPPPAEPESPPAPAA